MDKQIHSFLENNRIQLIDIYSKEREQRGDGILQITKNVKDEKIDIIFLELNKLPKELTDDIDKRKQLTKKTNIIFFFLVNGEKSTLLQIEVQ